MQPLYTVQISQFPMRAVSAETVILKQKKPTHTHVTFRQYEMAESGKGSPLLASRAKRSIMLGGVIKLLPN